jgi:GntR family transcriptional regulator
MLQFGAPRDVVREALATLRQEGVIERRQGIGTLVMGDPVDLRDSLPTPGTLFEHRTGAGRVTPRLLHWEVVPAPAVVAQRLDGVRPGDACLCIDYVLEVDGRPLAAITNHLRSPEQTRVRREDFTRDFYDLLVSSGIALDGHDLVLEACAAEPRVARLLDVDPGEPVLWIEQVIRDPSGAGINFATCTFRRELRMGVTSAGGMGLRDVGLPEDHHP